MGAVLLKNAVFSENFHKPKHIFFNFSLFLWKYVLKKEKKAFFLFECFGLVFSQISIHLIFFFFFQKKYFKWMFFCENRCRIAKSKKAFFFRIYVPKAFCYFFIKSEGWYSFLSFFFFNFLNHFSNKEHSSFFHFQLACFKEILKEALCSLHDFETYLPFLKIVYVHFCKKNFFF
jgi:hypothetical protein